MLKNLVVVGLALGVGLFGLTIPAAYSSDTEALPDMMNELSWLVGMWRGEAFGGVCEETWLPAAGGQMIGTFRLMVDGGIGFYEFMAIERQAEGFSLRLKHFNPDLTGWETKDQVVEFGPSRIGPGAVEFEGIAYRRLGDDSLLIVLDDEQADSAHERVELRLGRVEPIH